MSAAGGAVAPGSALRRRALVLVWAGELWNLVEAATALSAGAVASSTSLIAFGLDSVVELAAGAVLIWHLQREFSGQAAQEEAERKAYRLVGVTFFALAVVVGAQAIAALTGVLPEAKPSMIGIGLIVVSAAVMTALYFLKTGVGTKLNSPALRAEARQALFCDLQDVPVAVGLVASAVAGWWWADPLAALLFIPLFIREGREGWRGESCSDGCA